MDITQTIALTLGAGWASGINLYAAILMLGYLGATGSLDLPPDLQILSHPLVMLAVGEVGTAAHLAAAIAGGTLAAGSHATKAGTRVLINTSPEPVSNWFASVGEDVAVIAGLWTALHYPVLFIVLLVLFILLMIWLLPILWRGIRRIFGFIGRSLAADKTEPASDNPPRE
jgi:hypothetical protein